MRIGFDVSQTGGGKAGCGMMSYHLIRALAALDRVNEYVLYPAFGDLFWERKRGSIEAPAADNFKLALRFRSFESSRRFWTAPAADFEDRLGRPDIVQANNFFCPTGLTNARLVYFLHDVAFLEDPNFSTCENRTGCFRGVYEAALRADMIVANSGFTREHFLRTFPHYPAARVKVMHLASRFSGARADARPPGLAGMAPGEFFLCVGTIEPRKNHLRLFEAYARFCALSGADIPLVLAGGKGWLVDDAAAAAGRLGLGDRLILTGYLEDEALAWLYRNCLAFVYPSLFEGFGLPVVEALSLGAPVVTSSASSLPEVTGGAALLVDPLDTDALAEAMLRLWREPALREDLAARARERAGFFSWEKAARAVMDYHREAALLPKFLMR
ncbi:MAG: glycosyltransferase family 4 protein [Desulfovibrionaceae bacterium]|nr:glycosyltransferase family 4 protein [Desulfovibrionaceae bacterium]MBF0514928.1 glycosyltransferase family 4 protein [Desulfovibrionaceae bacterium]